jgi:predicted nucleotidyltransferase component of viral defense system
MNVKIIQDRLASYHCQSEIEETQALREITQELILAALSRCDLFKHAALQGGTCLRIFYGLNRFSEDLDFMLKKPDPAFEWKAYLRTIGDELSAYGYQIEIANQPNAETAVRKAFIKDDAIGKTLNLRFTGNSGLARKIRIRLEIDTNPPSGGNYELKYLDFPFVSSVVVQDIPTLFAGKIHALLCRDYIKGRDWYDFLWYTARKTPINYLLLTEAIEQMGPWKGQAIHVDHAWCINQLRMKIDRLDWIFAAEDVRRFIAVNEQPSLKLWGRALFLSQLEKIPEKR